MRSGLYFAQKNPGRVIDTALYKKQTPRVVRTKENFYKKPTRESGFFLFVRLDESYKESPMDCPLFKGAIASQGRTRIV